MGNWKYPLTDLCIAEPKLELVDAMEEKNPPPPPLTCLGSTGAIFKSIEADSQLKSCVWTVKTSNSDEKIIKKRREEREREREREICE